jgi:integrase
MRTGQRRADDGHREQDVPPLARSIIASVKPIASPVGYVFTFSGKSPVGGWSMIKNRLGSAMGNAPGWRLHGLRRTFVIGLADLGIRPDLAVCAAERAMP